MEKNIQAETSENTLASIEPTTPESDSITVPKEQLIQLIQKNKDLLALVSASVDTIIIVKKLLGGKLPENKKEIPALLFKIPKILDQFSKNEQLMHQLGHNIDTIKTIAPKHLSPETILALEK
jgi:hypothetical protein